MLRNITARQCVRFVGLMAILFSIEVGEARAENWTRFRGPNGSGVATEHTFPATWSDEDYLWKVRLPGVGHASPVGWEERVYITSGDQESGDVFLQCFAADDGRELWRRDFPGRTFSKHASNSFASATPAVDSERIYVTLCDGGKIKCVALTHTGEPVWKADLGDFNGPHGFAASPAVIEGVVCLQVDHDDLNDDQATGQSGALVGLEAANGNVVWKVERPAAKASYSTPCLWVADGGRATAISQSMSGGMQAVDVHSGHVVWQLTDSLPARTVSSPFLANDYLLLGVCGGGGSGKRLVGVQLVGDSPPLEQLVLTKHLPYVPTPVVSDNLMFLWHDQGKVSCVDLTAQDPSKLLWTKRIGGKFFGSPILAGDKVYCLSMDGRAIVINADDEFKLLGENDLGEPSSATPAVHQGRLYLRTESTIACLAAGQ